MTQLLFYENVAPVSPQRHADLSIERKDFGFASKVNSVPLTAVEIPAASMEYTIVFAGNEEAVAPVVVLGLEGGKNLYVKEDGTWNAKYIPAFVRRYPFVFSQAEDKQTFTLCLDEGWDGCNREGRGDPLFDDKQEKTQYLDRMLEFLKEYQKHFTLTQNYCKKIKELGLLEPMKAEFTLPGGEKRALGGFMAVNRAKLKELPPEKLAELVKSDELELTYCHLLSLNNFRQMAERASVPGAPPAAAPPAAAPE